MALASAAAILGGIIPGVVSTPAGAATITVTKTADDGSTGTLRWAVDQANSTLAADTIVLTAGATYQLTDCGAGSLVSVGGGDLTIQGNGATIQQTCNDGVIEQDDDSVLTLDNVTVEDGTREGGGNVAGNNVVLTSVTSTNGVALWGGGVYAVSSLIVTDSVITGNHADNAGGGIYSGGPVSVTNSTISDNTAPAGGGILTYLALDLATSAGTPTAIVNPQAPAAPPTSARLTLTDSTVDSNTAVLGGGIYVSDGADVTRSAVVFNQAEIDPKDPGTDAVGGGVEAFGELNIDNSTISDNSAETAGGGVDVNRDGRSVFGLDLIYGTLAGNSSPSGANIRTTEVGVSSFGTVVSNPLGGGQNCSLFVAPVSGGYNYEAAEVSCKFAASTDVSGGADPILGPIANNGGPTPTELPGHGSPLINAIPTSDLGCSGTDQRGIGRPQGIGCDIGAVEVQQPTAADGHYTTPNTQSLEIDIRTLVTDPDAVLNGGIYSLSDGPIHGLADAHEGGTVTYTPTAGYVGPDGFAYRVCDTPGTTCVNARVFIDVTGTAAAVVTKPVFTG